MTDETRKDQRVKVQTLKAKYKSATVDEFVEQYARDISRGGIFIKTPKPAAQGSMLKIEIQLTDGSPVIAAVGRVVWRREQPEGGQPAGMGIKFIKIEDSSLPVIERIAALKGPGEGPHFDEAAETAGPASGETQSEFFGSTNPAAEMPAPQDRTMMRQMSAFLGEALKQTTGAEAPKEPAKPAPAAAAAAPAATPAAKPAGPPPKRTMIGMPVPSLRAATPAAPAPAPAPVEEPKPAAKPVEEPKPAAKPAEEPKPAAKPAEEPKPAAKTAEPPKAETPKPAEEPAAKPAAPVDEDKGEDDEMPTTVADRRSVDQALKVAQDAAKDAVDSEPAPEEKKKPEAPVDPPAAKDEKLEAKDEKPETKDEKKPEAKDEKPEAKDEKPETKDEKKPETKDEKPEVKDDKKPEVKDEKKPAATPAKSEGDEKKPEKSGEGSKDGGEEAGSNTGLIIGMVVLVALAAVGIWWMMQQGNAHRSLLDLTPSTLRALLATLQPPRLG